MTAFASLFPVPDMSPAFNVTDSEMIAVDLELHSDLSADNARDLTEVSLLDDGEPSLTWRRYSLLGETENILEVDLAT